LVHCVDESYKAPAGAHENRAENPEILSLTDSKIGLAGYLLCNNPEGETVYREYRSRRRQAGRNLRAAPNAELREHAIARRRRGGYNNKNKELEYKNNKSGPRPRGGVFFPTLVIEVARRLNRLPSPQKPH
jgi:hypothetical protein